MSIICKLFGHNHKEDEILHHTGWSRIWNQAYNHHEFGFTCTRCNKRVVVGIVPTNKDSRIDINE